jgi:hypothetical protein
LGTEEWTQYASTAEAERALGLDSGNISACCRGKAKRVGEYEFKWADVNEEAVLPGEEWADCGQFNDK